jgi:hypothetical protein
MVEATAANRLTAVQLSCGRVIVEADECLDQAHAILVLLGNAFQVDDEADHLAGMTGQQRQTCFKELSGDLFHDALGGVSALLAAYKHVREADRAEV